MFPKSYLAHMKVNQSKKTSKKRKEKEIADKKLYRFKKKLDYKITHKKRCLQKYLQKHHNHLGRPTTQSMWLSKSGNHVSTKFSTPRSFDDNLNIRDIRFQSWSWYKAII